MAGVFKRHPAVEDRLGIDQRRPAAGRAHLKAACCGRGRSGRRDDRARSRRSPARRRATGAGIPRSSPSLKTRTVAGGLARRRQVAPRGRGAGGACQPIRRRPAEASTRGCRRRAASAAGRRRSPDRSEHASGAGAGPSAARLRLGRVPRARGASTGYSEAIGRAGHRCRCCRTRRAARRTARARPSGRSG